MERQKLLDVLIGARALIERGWIQGSSRRVIDGKACYCINGALDRAAAGVMPGEAYAWEARQLIRKAANCTGLLYQWNDAPERTRDEVLTAIDIATVLASAFEPIFIASPSTEAELATF